MAGARRTDPCPREPVAESPPGGRPAGPVATRGLPTARGAVFGQPLCRVLLRLGWRVRVLGAEHVPARGPVILAGNHTGAFDGPLMFGTSPRPVHVLTKREVFVGPVGPVLRAVGQIPLNRWVIDFPAILAALRVLANDRVLGLYPEGERGGGDFARLKYGAAYFALRTGAPIVPVVCFGGVRPGRSTSRPPRFRARIDMVYGAPFTVEAAEPWGPYLPRHLVAEASGRVRARLLEHLAHACELTGNPVPESAASPAPPAGDGQRSPEPAEPETLDGGAPHVRMAEDVGRGPAGTTVRDVE